MSNIQDYNISFDLLQNLKWEYDKAKHLKKIVQNKQDNAQKYVIDFINSFYDDVYNVDTANDFGLRIWELILNINFTVKPPPPRTNNIFGFGAFNSNFFNSNFAPSLGEDTSLSKELKRLVVKSKYQSYFAPSSIAEINRVVKHVLSESSYAVDNLNMSITVNIANDVDPHRFNAMKDYDLLPVNAGVSVNYIFDL